MSDYEKINNNVKVQIAARRNEAIKRIILILVYLLLALAGIVGLMAIGFISCAFAVILTAISALITAFKIGYVWHDVKF